MNENKKEVACLRILWIGTILVSIKSIFTDFGVDNAYQLAMSYRHLAGDRMLREMWEPHQTSIFLNDVLIYLYHLFVPSYAGVVLYLQICGTILFVLLGYLIYRILKERGDIFTAQVAWMFLITFRAKQTPFPEFSNLEIAFSILTFWAMIRFLEDQKKLYYPVLVGVFVFLQALSYPSCLLSVVAVLILFWTRTEQRFRNCMAVLGTLAALGVSYVGYFLIRMGFADFLTAIHNIFLSDSHSTFRYNGYWTGFIIMFAATLGSVLLAAGLRLVIKPLRHFSIYVVSAVLFLALELGMLVMQRRTGVDWTCSIYVLPLMIILLAVMAFRRATKEERELWEVGLLISGASFLSTLLLTDLGMITITAYLVLGGALSFLLLRHLCKDARWFMAALLLLVVVHRGLVIWGLGNVNGRVQMVWEAQNVIRSGPALGVVCDHVNKHQAKIDQEELASYLGEGDKVFFVGPELINPLVYLYANGEISNYSTIDTPKYNECLDDYFTMNPEKEPTVIAVSGWFGVSAVPESAWIMQWVHERYELVADGSYWSFYRKLD